MLRRSLLILLGAALLAPAAAPAATVDGGTSKLTFDRGLLALLSDRGVSVVSDPPARVVGRRSIALPVTGGDVAPATGQGVVAHGGAVILRRGPRELPLSQARLRIARGGMLTVRARGARVSLARVVTGGLQVRRQGVDTQVRGLRLELTGAGARLIERALRIDGLRRGLLLARVGSALRFGEIVVAGGGTTLVFDSDFLEALELEELAYGPLPGTEVRPEALLFPIASGTVGRGTPAARLSHLGGVRFTEGETRLELSRPELDVGSRSVLTAQIGATRVTIADVDATRATAVPGAEPGVFELRNLVLHLTEGAAQTLIDTFLASEFYPGQILGTAHVVARAA